jgi:membrane protein
MREHVGMNANAPVRAGSRSTAPARARDVVEPLDFGRDLVGRLQRNDASGMAAELAYRFVLAIFPFGLFLAALAAFVAAWLGMGSPTDEIMAGLGDNLPPELAATIRPELQRVIETQRPGIASLGAMLALWAATSGTMTAIKTMNRAYEVEENRPLLGRYALGIGLTLVGSIGILAAFVTIVGGALITEQIAEQLGAGRSEWEALSLLRWPLVFALLVVGSAVLYRVGPNMRPSWRAALCGGLAFAIGWLVATGGFALYVARIADYGATYGALGGVVVLLIWLYLTGLALIVGAEIVAIITERREPERLAERRDAISLESAAQAARNVRDRAVEAVSGGGPDAGNARSG